MAKYSQVKNFHFCGFMQFKRDNLLKTKELMKSKATK